MHGFVKTAIITPKLKVGNPFYNISEMLLALEGLNASFAVFPELSVTGYTAGDLFLGNKLLGETKEALGLFIQDNPFPGVVMIGAPFEYKGALYNTAFVIQKDKILGIIPKYYLPNNEEYYEKRWFKSAFDLPSQIETVEFLTQDIPFGNIIFDSNEGVSFGVEICEDMWASLSPGNLLSIQGAKIMFNLSASNDLLGKREQRKQTVLEHSRRNKGAYIYCSAGVHESTAETVFSGHNIAAINNELIDETEHFNQDTDTLMVDIDTTLIDFARRQSSSFKDILHRYEIDLYQVKFNLFLPEGFVLEKKFDRTPFVPKINTERQYHKIASLQENGLIKRINVVRTKHLVIGISGGLDSTLALLICVRAFDTLNIPRKNIIAVTMPYKHTSSQTYENAIALMKSLDVTMQEYPIKEMVERELTVINHTGEEDITYENIQARVRTFHLMTLANQYNGLVIGTGDLSEMALGFATYNGDHMSMYAVNIGIPKTLVRFMIHAYATHHFTGDVQATLYSIVDTPISPELRSAQETESIIGSYQINDFIIYRLLGCGDNEAKISWLVTETFAINKEAADTYVSKFMKRFFTQQFKRTAMPDGPKILSVGISPRADLRLVSDLEVKPYDSK
jgi:NAD+ synthase (glutamine-hydrolysing)